MKLDFKKLQETHFEQIIHNFSYKTILFENPLFMKYFNKFVKTNYKRDIYYSAVKIYPHLTLYAMDTLQKAVSAVGRDSACIQEFLFRKFNNILMESDISASQLFKDLIYMKKEIKSSKYYKIFMVAHWAVLKKLLLLGIKLSNKKNSFIN
jgi:hypothetical protein